MSTCQLCSHTPAYSNSHCGSNGATLVDVEFRCFLDYLSFLPCSSEHISTPVCTSLLNLALQVDPRPDGPSRNALLAVVARLAWAAALCGATQLAEQMAKRAAASPVSTLDAWLSCMPACYYIHPFVHSQLWLVWETAFSGVRRAQLLVVACEVSHLPQESDPNEHTLVGHKSSTNSSAYQNRASDRIRLSCKGSTSTKRLLPHTAASLRAGPWSQGLV